MDAIGWFKFVLDKTSGPVWGQGERAKAGTTAWHQLDRPAVVLSGYTERHVASASCILALAKVVRTF